MFENIECEWPLFFCYLILDYCFQGNKDAVDEYEQALEEVCMNLYIISSIFYNLIPQTVKLEPYLLFLMT